MPKFITLLKNRDFFLLWLGQIISQFGDRLTQMALIALIYKKSPGSSFELAKLFAFVIIPALVIGPVAGAFSDRWDKKHTMIISDIVRGLLVAFIVVYCFIVPDIQPTFPIYIAVFIIFSMTRFFLPAKMSIIPDLVSADKLLLANSLITTTGMIAAVLGLGLGGIFLLPVFGVKVGLIIDAFTFFLSAFLIFLIKLNPEKPYLKESVYKIGKEFTNAIKTSVLDEIKEGVKYLLKHKKMHFVIGTLFLVWSAVGASYPLIIAFIQRSLGTATKHLGVLVIFFGTGLFLGSIAYGRIGHLFSKTKAIFISLVISGFVLIVLIVCIALKPIFGLILLIAALFGMSIAPIMISANTIVHELLPQELRGRAFSSLEAVMHIAFLIFMILASVLAEFMDAAYILIAVGFLSIFSGLYGFMKVKR